MKGIGGGIVPATPDSNDRRFGNGNGRQRASVDLEGESDRLQGEDRGTRDCVNKNKDMERDSEGIMYRDTDRDRDGEQNQLHRDNNRIGDCDRNR